MMAAATAEFLTAFSERFEEVPGRMFRETTRNVSRLLYCLVRLQRPERVVELGAHIGATTCWLALAAAENRSGIVVAYDTEASLLDTCKANVQALLGERAPVRFRQTDAFVGLDPKDAAADFVFLDIEPKSRYEEMFDLLQTPRGGIVAIHDVCLLSGSDDPEARAADSPFRLYRRLVSDPAWEVILFPKERGTTIARRVA